MFYSLTNKRPRAVDRINVKEKPVYTEKIIAGKKTLVDSGERKNVYELTQSHAEETKIDNIIRRVALGDVRGLREPQKPGYYDLTNMPKTYREALQAMINLENAFKSLPLETKKAYNFSKEEFISDYGSEKFMKAVGLEVPKIEPMPEVTVIPENKEKTNEQGENQ